MAFSRRIAALTLAIAAMATCGTPALAADPVTKYTFDFGGASPGSKAVTPTDIYSKEKGFGFEPGANVKVVDRGAEGHCITSAKPFYFSVALPEGNYHVTITAGDTGDNATDLTVKAELRRLMVEKFHVDAGKTGTVSFVVNTRVPEFPGGKVRLKSPRETTQEAWAWDDKLTLEFNNKSPNIRSVELEKVNVPTIYLVGDSTMCD